MTIAITENMRRNIQERRIADKEVEEQKSMGKAAKENQERVVTEETKSWM